VSRKYQIQKKIKETKEKILVKFDFSLLINIANEIIANRVMIARLIDSFESET